MRWPTLATCLMLATATCGCLHNEASLRSISHFTPSTASADSTDTVCLRTGLLEVAIDDSTFHKTIWPATLRPVKHELAALLARNGLQVGVLTGLLPPDFDRLLTSEVTHTNTMARTFPQGSTKLIPINGPIDQVKIDIMPDLVSAPEPFRNQAVECALSVMAQPVADGRITLHCEPQMQYGDKELFVKPSDDGLRFVRNDQKPQSKFATLRFEVTLSPGEYLLIGPTADPIGTLGQAFFLPVNENRVRQRVLVVRSDMTAYRPADKLSALVTGKNKS